MEDLTHSELCQLTAKKFMKEIALIEYKCQMLNEEPDVLVFDSYSDTTLYEIKMSKNDFWKDWNKPFRIYCKSVYHRNRLVIDTLDYSIGRLRYYVCPADLIQIDELPQGWGLIWYKNNRFYLKKKSELFKNNKGLENRLLINAIKRVNENRKESILIKEYLGINNKDN